MLLWDELLEMVVIIFQMNMETCLCTHLYQGYVFFQCRDKDLLCNPTVVNLVIL